MKASIVKLQFSGGYDEYLYYGLQVFDTFADMCRVTQE